MQTRASRATRGPLLKRRTHLARDLQIEIDRSRYVACTSWISGRLLHERDGRDIVIRGF
jgi:hypothetical protein